MSYAAFCVMPRRPALPFVCLWLLGCTPSAGPPPAPPPHVVLPATTSSAEPVATHPAPAPKPELPPCETERRGLAERDSALRFSSECLPLLESAGDLRFAKKLALDTSRPGEGLDLSPLRSLVGLEEITLSLDPMPELDALAGLPALKRVWVLGKLASFAPLRPLKNIRTLSVEPPSYDAIADVSALSGLSALDTLVLRASVDLAELAKALPKLHTLVATGAGNLDALADFGELEDVTLPCFENDSVRVPAPPTLTALGIECANQPSPLGPVRSFPNLTVLGISDSGATSLAAVGKLKKLERLDAHGSQIRSLAPLAGCTALQWLDVHDTPITSLSPLGQLRHLKFIDAGNTSVGSLAPLVASKSLESLWLPGARVASVAPLAGVSSLREVMVPRQCDSRDVLGLHRARPSLKIMAWVEKSESEDPTCF